MSEKIIVKNKDAHFEYEILEKFEAGLSLMGWEVKSIRAGQIVLKGSYCTFQHANLFLENANVSQYMNVKCDEYRPRQLLLNKSELRKLREGQKIKGNSIVPLSIKWKNGFIKLDIALVRGKNIHDKRTTIKQRDLDRLENSLKKQNI